MKVCVYDNPATWMREAWQDGKLLAAHSATFMASKDFDAYARSGRMPFVLNCSKPFTPGEVVYGDSEAIDPAQPQPYTTASFTI